MVDGRSWQSLKERFRRSILKRLDTFTLNEHERRQLKGVKGGGERVKAMEGISGVQSMSQEECGSKRQKITQENFGVKTENLAIGPASSTSASKRQKITQEEYGVGVQTANQAFDSASNSIGQDGRYIIFAFLAHYSMIFNSFSIFSQEGRDQKNIAHLVLLPASSLRTYRIKRIEEFIKNQGWEVGKVLLKRPEISFMDLLLKYGVDKVAVSRFSNGLGGLAKIPESLLGSVEEAGLLFIKCDDQGYPLMTEKLILARAAAIPVVNSSFLMQWAEKGELPKLEEHPVMCEQWRAAGSPQPLPPITPKLFGGQKFSFGDMGGWMISGAILGQVIETLGGTVIDEVDALLDASSTSYVISSTPVNGREAFKQSWILKMVVAGRTLLSAKYRMEDETKEVPMSSQV